MTAEKQRIAIAETHGWYHPYPNKPNIWSFRGLMGSMAFTACEGVVPDYLNDLNAMHEAEKVLTYSQVSDYVTHLRRFTPDENWTDCWGLHATAEQRAEAFLRTLNKWEDA